MSDLTRGLPSEPGEHDLRLDLPAAHSAGRMARQMVRQLAEREELPEDEASTLEFVAGELLDNAVDHGGGKAAREAEDLEGDVRMTLSVSIEGGCWSVRVDDQGGGDLDQVRAFIEPPDGIPDLEDERGRGFFLMAQMVDELTVDRSHDGRGLALIASKRYGAPA